MSAKTTAEISLIYPIYKTAHIQPVLPTWHWPGRLVDRSSTKYIMTKSQL